jgi:hypothetical protein
MTDAVATATKDAIIAERTGVLGFARKFCAGVDKNAGRGLLSIEEGAALKDAVRRFADDIAIGLHRDGSDPDGVRAALRVIVLGESK